ncbi:MAG: long-chain fatty acid--CoA ligase [Rhodospirillales bacterium]|nr:long-chain fatty acid--CoA ligase [Rhodospirillales bacterium]
MNLAVWVDRRADLAPDKVAIRFDGSDMTYADLAVEAARLASVLHDGLGVGRGDRVAYLGYNSPQMIALLFAAARIGAILIPLNWRLAPPEHEFVLRDATPSALFVESEFVSQTEAIAGGVPSMRKVVVGDAVTGWLPYDDLIAAAGGRTVPALAAGERDAALICYTSGATGRPKGAILDQASVFWNAVNSTHMHDMTSADRILTTLPMFHVGGLNIQTMPALHAGATVVLHRKFDVEATFDAIERERITLTVLVPTQLKAMLDHPRWAGADLSSLRTISTGSTLVPASLINAVQARGVPLIQVYGSTETSPIAAFMPAAEAFRKVGSTGKAAVHCDIRIVDDEGRDVPRGTSGEILVRGPNVMTGYWNAPEATAEALRDGWFHSGDVGHFDDEGFLYVDDRKKDMIISGGENIYPAELEGLLAEYAGVLEAAVVGRPDDKWGEVAVACVVPKAGARLQAEDVIGYFQGRVARYKHPRDVVFLDRLPRNAMGKLQKTELRQIVRENAGEKA